MTTRDLRRKYLEFFESKGHTIYPSGSLIPYDVTGRLDESLLFNGAGMVQFKPYFRGVAEPQNKRMTTAQKCVRTGDIEDVGDSSHLTFFEMLGNFSFGDYFKEEAIAFSWEFLTDSKWLGLDPKRLSFTIFSEDDEAFEFWKKHLLTIWSNPEARIFRLGEDTNYWPAGSFSSGPPGPCGPNSEMFYWVPTDEEPPGEGYTREDWIRDDKAGKWLEIWNDVFIQYEWQGSLRDPADPSKGYQKEAMPNLPFQSIDTGMGLERTAAVLSGFSSVYDTDSFQAIIRRIESLGGGLKYGADDTKDRAIRIISDHIRTACFCIADGILPGNSGRGYVLRRLIRRAVLKGQRVLGFAEPFFHLVSAGVEEAMGDHYTELKERREMILETLSSEEALFRRTLSQGSELLTEWLNSLKSSGQAALAGDRAFMLYDTFGFPLEVTRELCEEAGVHLDEAGYAKSMAEAQDRSRAAGGHDTVYGGTQVNLMVTIQSIAKEATEFVGYEYLAAESNVVAVKPELDEEDRPTGRVGFALDATPFYAQSGGQVSDTGTINVAGLEFEVIDSTKHDGIFAHLAEPKSSQFESELKSKSAEESEQWLIDTLFNQRVRSQVDADRRMAIMRHHTATHLLHAALRERLGKHVSQAGSLVSEEHLRFDFTHGKAMTPEEIADVERWVNERCLAADAVETLVDVPIDEARALGAMALFGEKYGSHVRVVRISDMTGASHSVELCGGCHVRSTGQIGFFKILHEGSAASGIRRIEAVAGWRAMEYVNELNQTVKSVANLVKSTPSEVVRGVEKTLEQLKEERKKREKMAASTANDDAQVESIGPFELVVKHVDGVDPKEAQAIVDQMVSLSPNRVGLGVVKSDGKVTFIVKCGKAAVEAGAHAGNLVKHLATATGGGGGGRPEFATAGARNLDAIPAAIEGMKAILKA